MQQQSSMLTDGLASDSTGLTYPSNRHPSPSQHLLQHYDLAQDSDVSGASSPSRQSLDQQERRTSLTHLSSHAIQHDARQAIRVTGSSARTSISSKDQAYRRDTQVPVGRSSTGSCTGPPRHPNFLPLPATSQLYESPNAIEQGYEQQYLSHLPSPSQQHNIPPHRQQQHQLPLTYTSALPRSPAPCLPVSSEAACAEHHCGMPQGAYHNQQRVQDDRFDNDRNATAWDISFDRGVGSQYGPSTGVMGQIIQGSNHTLLLHRHQQLHSEANKFTEDLLLATDNPQPLERFKALDRVMSTLRRQQVALIQPEDQPTVLASPNAWSPPHAQEVLKRIIMVGECLAKFGTTEFLSERSCASRAITNRDYSALLRRFLTSHGPLFCEIFIEALTSHGISQSLADEALTVSTLLQTRCESSQLLFTQLIKGVGLDPGSTGGTLIINSTSANATPTNHLTSAPTTEVVVSNSAGASAMAWVKQQRLPVGALVAGGLAAAMVVMRVVRGKMMLGGGGGGGHGGHEGYSGGSGGEKYRKRNGGGGNEDLTRMLLGERTFAERAAVRQLAGCGEALRQAGVNDALLKNDWRFGAMRLAPPNEPLPPGYGNVDATACNLNRFLSELEGSHASASSPAGPVL